MKTKSPAGATQWMPSDPAAKELVPDAHAANKRHPPMMLTTDLALRFDPIYGPISKRFHANPDEFADAFAKAWFKLTHRDMGPLARYLGKDVPEPQLWQDPVPAPIFSPLSSADVDLLKTKIMSSGLSIAQLISVAWGSASTFRFTDYRGGANGARIRLSPQKDWPVNKPDELQKVLDVLEGIARIHGAVSMADLIVLGGCAAVELAAKNAGHAVKVPFSPGRTDATMEQTDIESFGVLEPIADGFRNFVGPSAKCPVEELLIDRAQMLSLTAPEMAVLVGGFRVLNVSHETGMGVLTKDIEKLNNAFFRNLLDMNTVWSPTKDANVFEGRDYTTKELQWKASRTDLTFGSNSQLRAIGEYYACDDAEEIFVKDFVKAFAKVMDLDRFDLKKVGNSAPSRL